MPVWVRTPRKQTTLAVTIADAAATGLTCTTRGLSRADASSLLTQREQKALLQTRIGRALVLARISQRRLSMNTTKTLAELIDEVEVTCADVVAIAQQLICAPDLSEACPPYGPPTLDTLALGPDGSVRCLHTAATPSVMETALLLQALIRRAHGRIPGGLRYAVGRALLEVEAPPFDEPADFSSALARFESGDRLTRLASLYKAAHGSSGEPLRNGGAQEPDRRRHQPSAADLRRQLRDADLRLYEARQMASRRPQIRGLRRTAPIAACMVAGVVLVAAGELSHVAAGRNSAPDAALPRSSVRTDMFLPPLADRPETGGSLRDNDPLATRTDQSDAAAATAGGTANVARPVNAAAHPRVKRVRSLADAQRSAGRRRAGADERQHQSAARTRSSDRGVLARIRFEWNNPFR